MVVSEEETLNRMKYEAFTKFVKDEEICLIISQNVTAPKHMFKFLCIFFV